MLSVRCQKNPQVWRRASAITLAHSCQPLSADRFIQHLKSTLTEGHPIQVCGDSIWGARGPLHSHQQVNRPPRLCLGGEPPGRGQHSR